MRRLGDTPQWFKASNSMGNGACVEVRSTMTTQVDVRDSKDPEGPQLAFSPRAWSAFVDFARNGEFSV